MENKQSGIHEKNIYLPYDPPLYPLLQLPSYSLKTLALQNLFKTTYLTLETLMTIIFANDSYTNSTSQAFHVHLRGFQRQKFHFRITF